MGSNRHNQILLIMSSSNPIAAWREPNHSGDVSGNDSNSENKTSSGANRHGRKGWESTRDEELIRNAIKNWMGFEITESDVLRIFNEVRGPAVTVDDVTTRLNCSPEIAERYLEKLVETGSVEKRTSSGVSIWWVRKNNPLGKLDDDVLKRLNDFKRGDETLIETYRRIRGSPPPELLKEIIADIKLDADGIEKAINEKQAMNRNDRDEIKDWF